MISESPESAPREELRELLTFLERNGYRRCDTPACNCNGWHGGNSAKRLAEIGDALTEAGIDLNGKTILEGVRELESRPPVAGAPKETEASALVAMFNAYQALKRLGWGDIIYCPKDGTHFDAIEAGSTGIHDANYEGEWPNGHWWAYDGDMWPSRPILFRLKKPVALPSSPDPAEEQT